MILIWLAPDTNPMNFSKRFPEIVETKSGRFFPYGGPRLLSKWGELCAHTCIASYGTGCLPWWQTVRRRSNRHQGGMFRWSLPDWPSRPVPDWLDAVVFDIKIQRNAVYVLRENRPLVVSSEKICSVRFLCRTYTEVAPRSCGAASSWAVTIN